MTPELATAIIVALGGASIIPTAIKGIRAYTSGRATAEKIRNRSALGRLVEAEEQRDIEAEFRREVENFAARLERMLIQLGVPEDKIPAWPVRKERSNAQ